MLFFTIKLQDDNMPRTASCVTNVPRSSSAPQSDFSFLDFWSLQSPEHWRNPGFSCVPQFTRGDLPFLYTVSRKGPTVINLHQSGGPIFSHHNNTRGVSWEVINSRWPCSRFWQSSPTLFPSTKASVRCLVWLWSHLCSFYSTPKPWGISCPQSWCPKAITGVVSYIHLPMTGMLLTIRCFIVL